MCETSVQCHWSTLFNDCLMTVPSLYRLFSIECCVEISRALFCTESTLRCRRIVMLLMYVQSDGVGPTCHLSQVVEYLPYVPNLHMFWCSIISQWEVQFPGWGSRGMMIKPKYKEFHGRIKLYSKINWENIFAVIISCSFWCDTYMWCTMYNVVHRVTTEFIRQTPVRV